MHTKLPSIPLVLGNSTESVTSVITQLENISNYCDNYSHTIIKEFLLNNTNVDKPNAQNTELSNQIKRASHMIMDQIFFKLETGTHVHLSEYTSKGNYSYGTHFMRFSRQSGDIEYGVVTTEGEERRATILPKSG